MYVYFWSCCPSVLERLQSFLPQMAEANEKLKQQMEKAPAGYFDIESVEEAQRVIEMVSASLLSCPTVLNTKLTAYIEVVSF